MKLNPKNQAMRRKLQLAIHRLQKGRSNSVSGQRQKINISTVAKEAGITPATIHNVYPDVAETIRALMGKTTREQRNEKNADLAAAKKLTAALRLELETLAKQIVQLGSENARLISENAELKAIQYSSNVVRICP